MQENPSQDMRLVCTKFFHLGFCVYPFPKLALILYPYVSLKAAVNAGQWRSVYVFFSLEGKI